MQEESEASMFDGLPKYLYFASWAEKDSAYEPNPWFDDKWPMYRAQIITSESKDYVKSAAIQFCETYKVLTPEEATRADSKLHDVWLELLITEDKIFEESEQRLLGLLEIDVIRAVNDGLTVQEICLKHKVKSRCVNHLLKKITEPDDCGGPDAGCGGSDRV